MSIVWEDPAPAERGFSGTRNRPKGETRLQAEAMLAELSAYPGKWARLWTCEDEVTAKRNESALRASAEKGAISVAIRETSEGWAVFAMAREPKAEESEEDAQASDGQAQGTFQ